MLHISAGRCQALPTIYNSEVVMNDTNVGSVALVTCKTGFHFHNYGNTSVSITCLPSLMWSSNPGHCKGR